MIRALNVDKLRLDMGEYVLSVADVHKRIGGRRALDGVDLDVKRAGAIALTGPAGAGKSLLFACIAGAARADGGRIRYLGYEIRTRPQAQIARIGVVRTNPVAQAFGDMTVLETVTVGALLRRPRLARARAHAREILVLAGLEAEAGCTFANLDAFGRRRLELARALATDPRVLLLDDLAGGLDVAARERLRELTGAARARGIALVAAARTRADCSIEPDDYVEIERGSTARNGVYATTELHV